MGSVLLLLGPQAWSHSLTSPGSALLFWCRRHTRGRRGQLSCLPQVAMGRRGRASFPYPCHYVADKEDGVSSSALRPSGSTHLCPRTWSILLCFPGEVQAYGEGWGRLFQVQVRALPWAGRRNLISELFLLCCKRKQWFLPLKSFWRLNELFENCLVNTKTYISITYMYKRIL